MYATTRVFILYIFSDFLYFILLSLFIYFPTFALYIVVLFYIFMYSYYQDSIHVYSFLVLDTICLYCYVVVVVIIFLFLMKF